MEATVTASEVYPLSKMRNGDILKRLVEPTNFFGFLYYDERRKYAVRHRKYIEKFLSQERKLSVQDYRDMLKTFKHAVIDFNLQQVLVGWLEEIFLLPNVNVQTKVIQEDGEIIV